MFGLKPLVKHREECMKKINWLGLTSIMLSAVGVLGYVITFFLFTRSGGHYTPKLMLLPIGAVFCAIGAVVTGAVGLRPVRALNLIGLILGVLLLVIAFIGVILGLGL